METAFVMNLWCGVFIGSYRTYEEWKLADFDKMKVRPLRVLTVPMRNGNSSSQRLKGGLFNGFLPYL